MIQIRSSKIMVLWKESLMVTSDLRDDGGATEIPWASVFDPAANITALAAIQAQGFRAATRVINQFVHSGPDLSFAARRQDGTGSDAPGPASMWERLITRLATDDGAAVDVIAGTARGHVQLRAANGEATQEVWLHNGGATDVDPVALRCSDLLSHDGQVLRGDAVTVDPNPVPMPGRCSRGVVIRVCVAGVAAGCYRGTLVADRRDVWLPITVEVPGD
jgi:hypothetical protein